MSLRSKIINSVLLGLVVMAAHCFFLAFFGMDGKPPGILGLLHWGLVLPFEEYRFAGSVMWGIVSGPVLLAGFLRFNYFPPPRGYCQKCSYDLRGSKRDSPCPECGWNGEEVL